MPEFKFGHVAPGGATDNTYTERPEKAVSAFRAGDLLGYGHIYFLFRPRAKRIYFANKRLGEAEIYTALSIYVTRDSYTKAHQRPMTQNKEDWKTAWRDYWEPIEVTPTLVVCPAWKNVVATSGQTVVSLDTVDAFGTGTHETTRLCLRAIEQIIKTSPVDSFLDVGCGSGVLAITAAKLGVPKVVGVDAEETAVSTSRQNATLNGVPYCEFSISTLSQVGGSFSLVCANIISSVLLTLWNDIRVRMAPDGFLVLSGLLTEEVTSFVEKARLIAPHTFTEGEWACLVCGPKD